MNKTKVRFPTYTEFEVTTAEFDLIHSMYYMSQKVTAIKFLRNQYSLSLLEAKNICDVIGDTSRTASY